jgi:hypothetical protein
MKVQKYRVALFSENPDKLADFYINVLKFKQVVKVDSEDDYGYGIEVAAGYKLWIARHSEINGKNTQPFRIILSLYVDNIHSYFSIIKKTDAKVIEEPTLTCENIKGEERFVGAFLDPDGNCIQLMQLL